MQFEVCTTTSRAWHAKHYAIMCPLYTSLYSLKFKAFPNINLLFPEVLIFIIVGGSSGVINACAIIGWSDAMKKINSSVTQSLNI